MLRASTAPIRGARASCSARPARGSASRGRGRRSVPKLRLAAQVDARRVASMLGRRARRRPPRSVAPAARPPERQPSPAGSSAARPPARPVGGRSVRRLGRHPSRPRRALSLGARLGAVGGRGALHLFRQLGAAARSSAFQARAACVEINQCVGALRLGDLPRFPQVRNRHRHAIEQAPS